MQATNTTMDQNPPSNYHWAFHGWGEIEHFNAPKYLYFIP